MRYVSASLLFACALVVGSALAQDSKKLTFRVIGSCEDCSHESIESALLGIEGISSFGYASNNVVSIIYNPGKITEQKLVEELIDHGYKVNGRGDGCCMLGDGASSGVDSEVFEEDEDPVVQDEEALTSIDNLQAEVQTMDVEDAAAGETRQVYKEAEAEIDAESDAASQSYEEVRATEETFIQDETDGELDKGAGSEINIQD